MNCSRKYTDRYVPKWQAPMRPTRIQVCFSLCLETLLVIALVAVAVIAAIVIMAPM
jgi:hypothetical protein